MNPVFTSERRPEFTGTVPIVNVLLVADCALERDLWAQALAARSFCVVAALGEQDATSDESRDVSPNLVVYIARPALDPAGAVSRLCARFPTARLVVVSGASAADTTREELPERVVVVQRERSLAEVVHALTQAAGTAAACQAPPASAGPPHFRPLAKQTPSPNTVQELKPRERDVLVLLVRGTDMEEAAQKLRVSRSTVEHYRTRLLKRFGFRRFPQLVYWLLTECRTEFERAAAALDAEEN